MLCLSLFCCGLILSYWLLCSRGNIMLMNTWKLPGGPCLETISNSHRLFLFSKSSAVGSPSIDTGTNPKMYTCPNAEITAPNN